MGEKGKRRKGEDKNFLSHPFRLFAHNSCEGHKL